MRKIHVARYYIEVISFFSDLVDLGLEKGFMFDTRD